MAATSNVLEWSSEIEADFVHEIEMRSNLWDIRDKLYTKKTLKRMSYEEIALKMTERWPQHFHLFTADLLLRKFGNLKTYYRRERKKCMQIRSGSSGLAFNPKWEHFSRLSFLDSSLIAEESRSNMKDFTYPTQDDETSLMVEAVAEEKGEIKEEEENECISESFGVKRCYEEPIVITLSRKKKNAASTDALNEVTNYLKKINNDDCVEEAFGYYIAKELKSIQDISKRELAKLKIHQVLYDIKNVL